MVNMNSVRKNVHIINNQIYTSTIMILSYTLGTVIHLSLAIKTFHLTITS